MCGRIIQRRGAEAYAAAFGAGPSEHGIPNTPARYNGAPGQDILVIRSHPETGERTLDALRWGLVPVWADDPKTGYKMINARSETAARLPSFRSAFAKRRCLIPIDGFYEWKKSPSDPKSKQPFAIGLASGESFALAGLWEGWRDKASGEWLRTFTILTCPATPRLTELHDRMPVIVPPDQHARWLAEGGQDLLQPYPGEAMTFWPVSTRVNSVRNNDATLLEPLAA